MQLFISQPIRDTFESISNMASSEKSNSSLHIPPPPQVIYNPSYNENLPSSSTVVYVPDSTLPVSTIIPSISKTDEDNQLSNEKRRLKGTSLMANVSHRLGKRKRLHDRLCKINNIMCFLGLLGMILMIIEHEITFLDIQNRDAYLSWCIRLIITSTTAILVSLVFYYHRLDLSLYAVDNVLDHWRVGLSGQKIFQMFFEAFICMIHPIPRYIPFIWGYNREHSTNAHDLSSWYTTMDVALGLPMFARVYLACRYILFHSHLVRHAYSQSLGLLNQVSFDFFFVLKTYITQWPIRCLLVFCTLFLLMGSWSLRACSYASPVGQLSIQDSIWLFIVTFTTVGYGDLTPWTYCGRSVAAISAFVGVLLTALLISVLAQKIEMTRSEKYVHNFVLNFGLVKQRKIQAANVVKFVIKLWYLRRKHQTTSFEYVEIERRLYRLIHFNQRLKQKQSKLVGNCISFPELITIQRETDVKIEKYTQRLISMDMKVDKLEEKLSGMNETIQKTLDLLSNRIQL